jgi:hypothetical protein
VEEAVIEKGHLLGDEVLLKGVAGVQQVVEERKKEGEEPMMVEGELRKGARARVWKVFVLREQEAFSR